MTEHHFVRHMLRSGDHAVTVFECRAPEDAPCRSWCQTCMDKLEDRCVCDDAEPPREPNLTTGHPCNYVSWMEEAPEESYDGLDQPVRGPDWQPVTFTWEGDYFVWDYAAAAEDDPVEVLVFPAPSSDEVNGGDQL